VGSRAGLDAEARGKILSPSDENAHPKMGHQTAVLIGFCTTPIVILIGNTQFCMYLHKENLSALETRFARYFKVDLE
jgi:hypothetical protein